MKIVSRDAVETIALGCSIAELFEAGDLVILSGDLGAGKTQFAKGVAQGLGIDEEVTSPSFNILFAYETGRIPLYHVDLYRLDSVDELEDTGIFDLLDSDGVCLIEWGERFASELGTDRLELSFSRSDTMAYDCEPERNIELSACGARSSELLKRFEDIWMGTVEKETH